MDKSRQYLITDHVPVKMLDLQKEKKRSFVYKSMKIKL